MLEGTLWAVYLNGQIFRGGFSTRQAADVFAERWQRGLCKHKDMKDHVEVKKDTEKVKEMNQRYDDMKRGNPQKINVYHGYME